ncbi:hypothetical protein [Enterococcus faecalis]|uniref:hypothetical protein n=1 Tax=Enterococcus faecalis TaxID=1351 RepID=UPI001330DF5C|nr:hypothetical protein [Enterococcus faecalis]
MESSEIVKRVRERVYFEVKKKYKNADLDSRIRDILYERSETFAKLRNFSNGKKIKKLADPRKFERFIATRGEQIINEVVDGLNNQPKMLATEYEKKVLDNLKQDLSKGLVKAEFSKFGKFDEYLADNRNYKILKKRLREEQDSDGFVYSDVFNYQLISDVGKIEEEIYETMMFNDYEEQLK